MDIDEAKNEYLRILPTLNDLNEQLKRVRKVERKCKNTFKKYCKDTGRSLTVGGKTFAFETKEKVVCTLDRVEDHFNNSEVERFKAVNTETKESFKSS